MPTEQVEYKPSEEIKLPSLVINEVDSNETFEKMKNKGLLKDNQLYLVTDEQGSGSADFVIEQNKRLEQKFWRGTKAEFNAVETKSNDTMYIIVDDDGTIPTPDVSGQINAHNTNAEAHIDIRRRIDAITVPTKVSELENDSGYLTSYTETDPTVPSWAKAKTKPTYTADEVGARPNTWMPTAAQVGAATEEYVNQAIQTAIGDALGGSY